MRRWTRYLEIASNASILFVAIAIGVVLIKEHRLSGSHALSELKRGDKFAIDLPQPSPPKTLVLALSTSCHFCSESAPFYQSLSRRVDPSHVHLMAVFPQTADEARTYLQGKSIPIQDIHQQNFQDISVQGTPTLILLDSSGKILKTWIGVLDKESQESVIQQLNS